METGFRGIHSLHQHESSRGRCLGSVVSGETIFRGFSHRRWREGIALCPGVGQMKRLASNLMNIFTAMPQCAVDNSVENGTQAVVRKGLGQRRCEGFSGYPPRGTLSLCFSG